MRKFLAALPLVAAHRGLLTKPSCDDDFGSSSTALVIPDPSISWAFKHYLDCTHRSVWSKFTNDMSVNRMFYVGVGIPPKERFGHVRADALIIGPGLPELTDDEWNYIPNDIKSDPIWNANGKKAYLFKSPEDQSSCAHLGVVMQQHCTVKNGRCDFYETFGQTNSWRVLDADANLIPAGNSGGEYYVAVWLQNHESSKLGIALGTWVENFWSSQPTTTPTCSRAMGDYSEKYGTYADDFPVQACETDTEIARPEVVVPPTCDASSTCSECDGAAACKSGVIYPEQLTCTADGSANDYKPMMGCGGSRCPKAVKLWDDVNMKMHSGMAINFSGDVALDFVRAMVPHHQGALDMCEVLLDDLTCTPWENVEQLDGMVHLCTHIRLEQEREVAGMKNWLAGKNEELETTCEVADEDHSSHDSHAHHDDHRALEEMDHSNHDMGGDSSHGEHSGHQMRDGCGEVATTGSKAFIEANHLMHGGMGVHLSC